MIKIKHKINNFLIEATIFKTGEDFIIVIEGGESHIGAVGISFPAVSSITNDITITTSVVTMPSHKEDVVVKLISEKVAKATNKKVVTIAGIHYNNISKNEIDKILKCCEKLAEKIIREIDK